VAQPVYGLSHRNTDLFGKTVHVAHNLDRVVVVDRGDHTCYFQL